MEKMELLKPGSYLAKVAEHGISETKAGDLQAFIVFSIATKEGSRELTWFGSFKAGALKYTLQALVNCGLEGNNPMGALKIGMEVSVVVNIDQDLKGNDRNRIAFVNKVGGVIKTVPAEVARAKLEQYSSAVMALKQLQGGGAVDEVPF